MKHHLAISLCVWLIASVRCQKTWDEPPVYNGPALTANLSIRQLRDMHLPGGFEKIMQEYIIAGQVVANDSSDNFYKTIVLQDSTAGITLRLDATGLYSTCRMGREMYVRLNGLWLGDYAGMLQIGAAVDRTDPQYPELLAIPQPLLARHIAAGPMRTPLMPLSVTIDQLSDSLQSCLVAIESVELPPQDSGKTYADAVNKLSANRTLQTCLGTRISLRTSGFASFAGVKTPRGNGRATGIYSVFRNEKQLLLRDTADLQLTGLRCVAGGIKTLLAEDFETPSFDASQPARNWKSVAETGNRLFEQRTTQSNGYAEINAFASGQPALVSWLISPPVNLSSSSNEQLSFVTRDGFDNGATMQVLVSSNYDGGPQPWKAKWTSLKATISKGSVNNLAPVWVSSGTVSLHSYQGVVYIAFRYEGADPVEATGKRTTRFQVDKIRILGN